MTGDAGEDRHPEPLGAVGREPRQKRSSRLEINGWINLDKPTGVSSTQAVGRIKFLFNAKKAGHAGTLDPLASGVLPVAFGEATRPCRSFRTGPSPTGFACAGARKARPTTPKGRSWHARSGVRPQPRLTASSRASSAHSPDAADLLRYPHRGARAYDLAREGETFEIEPRPIHVYRLDPDIG